ncbi:MAG: FAD/NAD(P)-binding protein [Blastocatellia bacterium]
MDVNNNKYLHFRRNSQLASTVQKSETQSAHVLAIIGLGPKGFYCLERLLAEFQAHPLHRPLHIHVFNRSAHFGASPVYDPNQPEYILVNISVGEIDLWTPEEPPGIVNQATNFVQWYQDQFSPNERLTGEEFLSRAVVGQYLIDGFQKLLENVPIGASVFCHVGEVMDIQADNGKYLLQFISDNTLKELTIDKVLLATGHSRLQPGNKESRYQAFARQHDGALFIPFAYPVVGMMGQIPDGATVAMQGIGLTFIDAVLELTEGRGGRFERVVNERLMYIASGNEPKKIIPFSRTGLPMTPKAQDLPSELRPLTFFTHDTLAKLKIQAEDNKLHLERQIWPLFGLEMELCYYRVLMEADGKRQQLEACGDDAEAMRRVISEYLKEHPRQEPFNYWQVLDPIGERRFESGEQFASFIEQYLEQEIARARRGHAGCAVKAAIDIWYEARKELGSFLQFGGLTPESHQKLIEYYYPRLKRVVFGPPIINTEKLLALQKTGLLDFSVACNPEVVLDEASSRFKLRNTKTKTEVMATVLVDARYPGTHISKDASALYRNLYDHGMIREFENGQGQYRYCPGAIDMTKGSRFVIDATGAINQDIAVIGIPTEGNLVGNLTMGRDEFAVIWAAEIIKQLRNCDS